LAKVVNWTVKEALMSRKLVALRAQKRSPNDLQLGAILELGREHEHTEEQEHANEDVSMGGGIAQHDRRADTNTNFANWSSKEASMSRKLVALRAQKRSPINLQQLGVILELGREHEPTEEQEHIHEDVIMRGGIAQHERRASTFSNFAVFSVPPTKRHTRTSSHRVW
jgi:hypothetical protein